MGVNRSETPAPGLVAVSSASAILAANNTPLRDWPAALADVAPHVRGAASAAHDSRLVAHPSSSFMNVRINRRDAIRRSVAFAAVAFTQQPLHLFGLTDPEQGTVIPFQDIQPPGKMLRWEDLTSWLTPNEQVFAVSHYGTPAVELDAWKLEISGLVQRPRTLTLAELKARKRQTVVATLECSGNSSNPGFMGAIGNVRWTGTALAPLLRETGLEKRAIEVAFFGADEKVEKIREKEYPQNFARSLSRADALRDEILLAYEMNDQPLGKDHGAPLRLVVPGWFGIAWVKWLTRIEILDRRYMSRFMARDYVTIRGEERDGKTIWRETSVGPIDVKSVVARALRLSDGTIRLQGAAWTDGTPLKQVDLQIDGGPWRNAKLDRKPHADFGWSFWSYDWKGAEPGDHVIVSRAVDADGRAQPSADDPSIKLKRTYWEANQQWPRKLRL
jgi:DMSO/TMAO reductase YedYZ molybdopterin-dependent catalytic subunit